MSAQAEIDISNRTRRYQLYKTVECTLISLAHHEIRAYTCLNAKIGVIIARVPMRET